MLYAFSKIVILVFVSSEIASVIFFSSHNRLAQAMAHPQLRKCPCFFSLPSLIIGTKQTAIDSAAPVQSHKINGKSKCFFFIVQSKDGV